MGRFRSWGEIFSTAAGLYLVTNYEYFQICLRISCSHQLSFPRWCAQHCDIQPGTIQLTKTITTPLGGKVIKPEDHAVLWPWDILHHLWLENKLLNWIYDPEDMAVAKVEAASIIQNFLLHIGARNFRETYRAQPSNAKHGLSLLRNIGPTFRTFPSLRSFSWIRTTSVERFQFPGILTASASTSHRKPGFTHLPL